jgi:hypothetical protein
MPDRSDHEDVQVILHKIHKGGINYIKSVSKSFKTAESGLTFAKTAQELCITLSSGRDECSYKLIQDSIAKMQDIAQKSHTDANTTAKMLNATSQEFTQVRRSHTDES